MQNLSQGAATHPDEDGLPKSTLVSRNVTVQGRRTSVRLEPEMWTALKEISNREKCSIHDICGLISLRKNENTSLTAAIRVFLMLYFRASSTEDGHSRAGHGSFDLMKQRAKISSVASQEKERLKTLSPCAAEDDGGEEENIMPLPGLKSEASAYMTGAA
jgi:predicted DNA-binding ribbon-helix-helix protein